MIYGGFTPVVELCTIPTDNCKSSIPPESCRGFSDTADICLEVSWIPSEIQVLSKDATSYSHF